MSDGQQTIIYTLTDEAPLLATYAFLPIIRTFLEPAGIDVKTSDISVAARILAEFGDYLTEDQRVQALLGGIEGMWISTFHSMCARILRREGRSGVCSVA